jgi:DNA-binding response OmpR family regulator
MSREAVDRASTLIQRARGLLDRSWDRAAASDTYEEAEALADLAQAERLDSVSEALLGFSAYLSSFVDSALMPRGAQADQLRALTDAIGEALTAAQSEPAHPDEPVAIAPIAPTLYYLGSLSLGQDLSVLVSQRGHDLKIAPSAESLVDVLTEDRVQALIIEASQLAALKRLYDLGNVVDKSRPPLIVVSKHDDLAHRLAAIRMGADAFFVLFADAARLAARLREVIDDRHKPYCVLIVDDDASMTLFCGSILRHNGMETRAVNAPEAAIEALADFQPDVIIADLYMPEISGLELVALFRAHPKTLFTPVILLSGDDDAEKRFDTLIIGGDDYLTKPIRPRHLVAAVASRARRARWLKRELIDRG